jgi:hypothetical protein
MKYTILDANGLPTAFYSDDIHENIPADAIEITDEQWLECINNSGTRQFVNGTLVAYVAPITLEQAKATKISEAIAYLVSTDYMMTSDYDKDTTEVRGLRQQARYTIRGEA